MKYIKDINEFNELDLSLFRIDEGALTEGGFYTDDENNIDKIEDSKLKKEAESFISWAKSTGLDVTFLYYQKSYTGLEYISFKIETTLGDFILKYDEKKKKAGISDYSYSQQYERTGKAGWHLEYPGKFNRYDVNSNQKATSLKAAQVVLGSMESVGNRFEEIVRAIGGKPSDFNITKRTGKGASLDISQRIDDKNVRIDYSSDKNGERWGIFRLGMRMNSGPGGRGSRPEPGARSYIPIENFKDLKSIAKEINS